MTGLRALLYLALGGSGLLFSAYALAQARRAGPNPGEGEGEGEGESESESEGQGQGRRGRWPGPALLGIGFVTNFFDTLGIGSFAPTTAIFKLLRLVPDQLIPGTLMIGHLLPILAQALIYITVIEVDTATLVLLIAASVAGSYLGARRVARFSRRRVQLGMGGALLLASTVMLAGLMGLVPAGGDLIALSGVRLGLGMAGNFVLGALMTIGVGAYAPSLILFGLLGMNVRAIFPIMMGSCALIMPAGGVEFVRERSYSQRAALGLTLGGIPGVLLAAFVVRQLPLATLRWLVLAVVVYTALAMLRAGLREPRDSGPAAGPGTPRLSDRAPERAGAPQTATTKGDR
jgi:uncharacterized membrane protein YfcA